MAYDTDGNLRAIRVVSLSLLAVAANASAWLLISPADGRTDRVARKGGDPGHLLLTQLTTVSEGLPEDAHVVSSQASEPQWDTCDGNPATAGWTDAVVSHDFTSGMAPAGLLATAKDRLRTGGWTLVSETAGTGGPRVVWRRTLTDRNEEARATLTISKRSPNDPGVWSLVATATPLGQRARGC